ncbi:MAG: DHH family phosphoesterase, partial [Eubacterium sp.]|nr:DHH family phosphoesterase [Eubacterium sp.]
MAKNALKGTLKSYLRWPILLAALLIIMNIQIYTINFTAGLVMSGYVLLYLIFAILIYTFKRNVLIKDLVNYAMSFHSKTFNIAKSIDLPICILDPNGNCVWQNKLFASTFSSDLKKNFHITDAIAALTQEYLPEASDKNCELHFTRDDNFFRAVIQRLNTDQEEAEGAPIGIGEDLYAVFVYDETEIVHVIRENYDQRLDICLLYIDNYDESLGAIEEVRRALIAAIIDRKITKHMLKFDAITRRLEKDKYIILFQHKYLSEMQADKFSLLEEIKSTNIAEDKSATISMGIGIQAKTFRKRQEYAQSAIDLALARGGDQVVIKSKDNILYYGGKSVQQEKNTRVKARVKAQALRESIGIADKIVIMGHRLPDVDAIGSAIGINRISQTLGKPTHIVVNEVTSSP